MMNKKLFIASGLTSLSLSPFNVFAEENIEYITVKGDRLEAQSLLVTSSKDNLEPDNREQLSRLPGVAINSNGNVTGVTQYRGLFGDRVNFKIDGALIASAGPNAMDAPLSYVISSHTQLIKVFRGIAPVSTGYETIGGTIITETQNNDFGSGDAIELSGNIGFIGGENGDERGTTTFVSAANQHYYGSLAYENQKGDNVDSGEMEIPSTFYDKTSYRAEMGFKAGNHTFSGQIAKQDTDKSGTPALAMDIDFIDSDWYRLKYDYLNEDDQHLEILFYGNDSEHQMNNFTMRPSAAPAAHRETFAESDADGIDVTYSAIWDDINWSTGFTYSQVDHDATIRNPSNPMLVINNFNSVERDVYSGFLEASTSLTKALEVTAGIRFTNVDSDAGEVSHSMAMMNPNIAELVNRINNGDRSQSDDLYDIAVQFDYMMSEDFKWTFGIAQKERAPSYQERYSWFPLPVSSGLADGKNYIGQLDLDKETSMQIDVGFDMSYGDLFISPRVFYQDIDDYIQGVPTEDPLVKMVGTMMGDPVPLVHSNTDATLSGFDVLATYQLTSDIMLESTVSYVRGKRDDIDDSLYRIAPLTAYLRANWQYNDLMVSLENKSVAHQSKVSQTNIEEETGGYSIFNLMATWTPMDNLVFTAKLKNLTDKYYADHLSSTNRVAGAELAVGEKVPGIGRALSLGVRYHF